MITRKYLTGLTALLLLTGCSPFGGGKKATTTTTTVASSAGTAANGVPRCSSANLSGSVVRTDNGADQRFVSIQLKNTGSAKCTSTGFPGVTIENSAGVYVSKVVLATDEKPGVLTVPPGQTMFFDVRYSKIPKGGEICQIGTRFNITPPDDKKQLQVLVGIDSVCAGAGVTVTPVRAVLHQGGE